MPEGYTYQILIRDIQQLKLTYPFLEVGSIGYSILGKSIPYIRIGSGEKEVFYNGSFHANEWITTPILMRFIEDYSAQYAMDGVIGEFSARQLYNAVSLFIVPMVNPDGVDLVTGGLQSVDNPYKNAQEIAKSFPDIPFPSGWKANIDGVDLNLQFPAGWKEAREIKFAQGYTKPAPRDFVGDGPLVAREALAVYNFTLVHNFRLVIAFHTQGQEIYWKYLNYNPPFAEFIGQQFSRVSGYRLADVPYQSGFAGYKDWFIQNYNRPGYTIEAGIGENPLPIEQFSEIYRDVFGIMLFGLIF